MHLTLTEWIWFTAAASILGTVAAGLLWTWFTRRAHRGEHGRHDPNNSPAAVIAQVAQSSRAMEPFRDLQARLNTDQQRRNDPRFAARHTGPEPDFERKLTRKAA